MAHRSRLEAPCSAKPFCISKQRLVIRSVSVNRPFPQRIVISTSARDAKIGQNPVSVLRPYHGTLLDSAKNTLFHGFLHLVILYLTTVGVFIHGSFILLRYPTNNLPSPASSIFNVSRKLVKPEYEIRAISLVALVNDTGEFGRVVRIRHLPAVGQYSANGESAA